MIQQGHRYHDTDTGLDVLALDASDSLPRVAPVCPDKPGGLGEPYTQAAWCLQPLPMRYFHGELPA